MSQLRIPPSDTPCPYAEHCWYCGRRLIETTEPVGFNTATGERTYRHFHQCPRFARSWRNLWMGGAGHESHLADARIVERQWR